MRETEFLQTLHFNTFGGDGTAVNQSVPIVLPATEEDKVMIDGKAAIALAYDGKTVAILQAPEVYDGIREERCSRSFGLANDGHPYIKKIYEEGPFLVGG